MELVKLLRRQPTRAFIIQRTHSITKWYRLVYLQLFVLKCYCGIAESTNMTTVAAVKRLDFLVALSTNTITSESGYRLHLRFVDIETRNTSSLSVKYVFGRETILKGHCKNSWMFTTQDIKHRNDIIAIKYMRQSSRVKISIGTLFVSKT